MHMTRFLYEIRCPRCDWPISLPQTSLVRIIRDRIMSDTDERLLVFVCQECMSAFRCETHKLALTDTPLQNQVAGRIWFSILAQCDDSNCPFREELITIREPGTTIEQCLAQVSEWKLDGILCDEGHQIVLTLPDTRTYIGQV
jgi:hypothetical protein